MFRATGPGKTEIDTKYSTPGNLKAMLYNFDFDDMKSGSLKPEHARFLSEKVVPLLTQDRGNVWMRGSASRIGADEYNLKLSKVRVDRMATFLMAHGVKAAQMQTEAVGEELAIGPLDDDERDRSVVMIVQPKVEPPKKKVPPKPLVSQNFKIAMVTGLSASQAAKWAKYLKGRIGFGIAFDALFFQIWDTTNKLACIYFYLGAPGVGIGLTLPATVSEHGPWNPFKTSAPISSAQFIGTALFSTIGAGDYTANWIELRGMPQGVDKISMAINTGRTWGAGASATKGGLLLLEGPTPFGGP